MSAVVTPTITRYCRHPRPFQNGTDDKWAGMPEAAREKTCERTVGHVLTINEKGIICLNCGAEWHDYQH